MEILGIGPLELFFIILLALIVLGPNDMVKAGRTLGRWMRKLVTSDTWQTMQQTSRNLRYLPTVLMREAGLEEEMERMKTLQKDMPSGRQIEQILGLEDINKDLNAALPSDLPQAPPPPGAPQPEPEEIVLPSPPPPGTIPQDAPEPAEAEPKILPPSAAQVFTAPEEPDEPASTATNSPEA